MSKRSARRSRAKLAERRAAFDRIKLERRRGKKRPGSTSRKSRA